MNEIRIKGQVFQFCGKKACIPTKNLIEYLTLSIALKGGAHSWLSVKFVARTWLSAFRYRTHTDVLIELGNPILSVYGRLLMEAQSVFMPAPVACVLVRLPALCKKANSGSKPFKTIKREGPVIPVPFYLLFIPSLFFFGALFVLLFLLNFIGFFTFPFSVSHYLYSDILFVLPFFRTTVFCPFYCSFLFYRFCLFRCSWPLS